MRQGLLAAQHRWVAGARNSRWQPVACLPGCQSAGRRCPWGEAPAPRRLSRESRQSPGPPGTRARDMAAKQTSERRWQQHGRPQSSGGSDKYVAAGLLPSACALLQGVARRPARQQVAQHQPHLGICTLVLLPDVLQHDEVPARWGASGLAQSTTRRGSACSRPQPAARHLANHVKHTCTRIVSNHHAAQPTRRTTA